MKHYSIPGTSYHEVNEVGSPSEDGLVEMKQARPAPVDGIMYISTVDGDWVLPVGDETVERTWRDSELQRADVELNKVQDGDGVGTVKAWREYRMALRAWPSNEKFPDSTFRPVSPDAGV